ncbi:alginate O-acetyltransferase AlgF, partial [Pseudomonas aeruginosa]
ACAANAATPRESAQADEGALYGPQAPKGSAFVRAYNAGNSELDVSVGSTSLNDVAPLGSSDFKFLPPGSYTAQV